MGSNQFQRDYIEYLQDRNTELLNKLTHMKENYENKIFSKDLSKHYLLTALEDIMGVCTALPRELDLFFEKLTGAMEVLTNVLLRKSEMVQLVEKISQTIDPKGFNADLIQSLTSEKEQISDMKTGKKAGTVKVSPMINGHVISTDPKIYLSRISKELTPRRRSDLHHLSPIIEASPDPDLTNLERCSFKELRIPLERLNLRNLSLYNRDSPKGRFKGTKTWKKSLSLKTASTDSLKISGEDQELLKEKPEIVEIEKQEAPNNDVDPLEGPSWLYEENNHFSPSSFRSKTDNFVDYRRRKHRFASVFDRNDDFICLEPKESEEEALYKIGRVSKSDGNISYEFKDCNDGRKNVSKDFIPESESEEEDNNSFSKRKLRKSLRKSPLECSNENDLSENERSPKKKLSYSREKIKACDLSLHKSDSNYEADNEENVVEQKSPNKSYKKRRSKTIFDELPMEISPGFRSTPKDDKTPESTEKKVSYSKKSRRRNAHSKSGERNSKKSQKIEKEIISKMKDSLAPQRSSPRLTQNMSPTEKKNSYPSRQNSEISNPMIIIENEVRKKRKAAPTNLSEPSLVTKLRRD